MEPLVPWTRSRSCRTFDRESPCIAALFLGIRFLAESLDQFILFGRQHGFAASRD